MIGNSEPTSQHRPRAKPEIINLDRYTKFKEDIKPSDLLNTFLFGQEIWFTQPLQRKTGLESKDKWATSMPRKIKFFWEPSGGLNRGSFHGIVVGVRTLSAGLQRTSGPERDYQQIHTFPVLVIAFSPYRKPVYVLPWHTFDTPQEYQRWRELAEKSLPALPSK